MPRERAYKNYKYNIKFIILHLTIRFGEINETSVSMYKCLLITIINADVNWKFWMAVKKNVRYSMCVAW